jgi:positive regulator of sigma E activity
MRILLLIMILGMVLSVIYAGEVWSEMLAALIILMSLWMLRQLNKPRKQ